MIKKLYHKSACRMSVTRSDNSILIAYDSHKSFPYCIILEDEDGKSLSVGFRRDDMVDIRNTIDAMLKLHVATDAVAPIGEMTF